MMAALEQVQQHRDAGAEDHDLAVSHGADHVPRQRHVPERFRGDVADVQTEQRSSRGALD